MTKLILTLFFAQQILLPNASQMKRLHTFVAHTYIGREPEFCYFDDNNDFTCIPEDAIKDLIDEKIDIMKKNLGVK